MLFFFYPQVFYQFTWVLGLMNIDEIFNKFFPLFSTFIKVISVGDLIWYMRRTLLEKCPYSELFWSAFPRIWTEYEEIRSISPYSVWMRENAGQNNSKHGHFLRSGMFILGIVPLMEYDLAGLTLRCLGGPAK